MIRVLIVDDSSFLRRQLPRLLEMDSDIKVVGAAANGAEAVQLVKALRPDVVTMDIVMPVMDGLTALKHIMRDSPVPVVMVSSITREGANETIEALSLGAVDFTTKPSSTLELESQLGELVEKIKQAYANKIKLAATVDVTRDKFRALVADLSRLQANTTPKRPRGTAPFTTGRRQVVAIATSTGGPAALQLLLARLPADLAAGVLIVQHIAPGFTRPLAERLNSISPLTVREAVDGEPIRQGYALLAPAGSHLTVSREPGRMLVRLSLDPAEALHRPSADVLFKSLAQVCPKEACGVILTGMGDDGARGLRALFEAGGDTLAQDEFTSLIYGMPKRAVEMGGVRLSLPLDQIADEVVKVVNRLT